MPPSPSFRELAAPAPLRDRVWSLWAQRGDGGRQRVVPDGSLRLVCRLGHAPELWGPRSAAASYVVEAGESVVGVRLRPWAARSLGGPSAGELRDRTVAAEEVLGAWAVELGERVAQAGPGRAAVAVLTAAVRRRIRHGRRPDPLVARGATRMLLDPVAPVASTADAAGVSARHLRRRFEQEVGLSPKELQRQLRFQLVLAQVQRGLDDADGPRLADLAHRAGFVDQAHLTHECVRLTGVPPGRFVAETRHRCADGHDHGAAFAPLGGVRD